MARGPAVDAPLAPHGQRRAKVLAERHRPQPEDGMRPAPGGSAGEVGAGTGAGRRQPRDQILGQERRVGREARDQGASGRVRGRPVERGQDAGERPGMARHAVGHHGQAVGCEARRVPVRVEDQRFHLRCRTRDHPGEQRLAGEEAQALVAAPHAAGQATGQKDARDAGGGHARRGYLSMSPMHMYLTSMNSSRP